MMDEVCECERASSGLISWEWWVGEEWVEADLTQYMSLVQGRKVFECKPWRSTTVAIRMSVLTEDFHDSMAFHNERAPGAVSVSIMNYIGR